MNEATNRDHPFQVQGYQRKAIHMRSAWTRWAVRDDCLFLRPARVSNSWESVWYRIRPCVTALLDKLCPASLNLAIVLIWSHPPWYDTLDTRNAVTGWVAAVLAIQFTDEVGQSAGDMLLQNAFFDSQ
jgi:hypothetical protein